MLNVEETLVVSYKFRIYADKADYGILTFTIDEDSSLKKKSIEMNHGAAGDDFAEFLKGEVEAYFKEKYHHKEVKAEYLETFMNFQTKIL